MRYYVNEVGLTGCKSAGVKAISLKNDYVVSADVFNNGEYISVFTEKGTGKRVRMSDFEITSRAIRGIQLIRDVKNNPYYILKVFVTNKDDYVIK